MTDMAFSHYKVVMSKFSSGTQRNDTCMNESIVHSDSRVHQDQCVDSTELLYIYFTIAKMDTPSTDCHFQNKFIGLSDHKHS